MYFDAPEAEEPLTAGTGARVALSVNGLAMLALGLVPRGVAVGLPSGLQLRLDAPRQGFHEIQSPLARR